MDKEAHPTFPQEGEPRNSEELARYNLYIHSDQDLQCSDTLLHRTCNLGNTWEEPKWLSVKSIHEMKHFDNQSHSRRCSYIKIPGQRYNTSTSPWHLIPYTDGRWNTYFSPRHLSPTKKKTVVATMMLFNKKKVKVRPPDGDPDYFDIVAGLQQGYTFALYLFIICLENMLRTSIDLMKENGFKLAKEKKQSILRTN